MYRYMVERTFPGGLNIPTGPGGEHILRALVACDSDRGVTWLHTHVAIDQITSYWIYDAPSPEAIRLTSLANSLPVDRIVQVSTLSPDRFAAVGSEVVSPGGVGNAARPI